MKIQEPGGRIKSASIGLNDFYNSPDIVTLQKFFKEQRDNPPHNFLISFFPYERETIRGIMKHIGSYRPTLKTDQGMPGNFLPFSISRHPHTPQTHHVSESELYPVLEAHADQSVSDRHPIYELSAQHQYKEIHRVLHKENLRRRVDVGRSAFFFIRPTGTENVVEIGANVIQEVEMRLESYVESLITQSRKLEKEITGSFRDSNLIYAQPDVFISQQGEVSIEKVHFPDVGFFLSQLPQVEYSKMIPKFREISSQLLSKTAGLISNRLNNEKVFFLTRNDVLLEKQDTLEILELSVLQNALQNNSQKSEVFSLSQIDRIPMGSQVLLMNLDYKNFLHDPDYKKLIARHAKGEIHCFPNPFLQYCSQRTTGLKFFDLEGKYMKNFLHLVSGIPKNDGVLETTLNEIDERLRKFAGIESDIIHAQIFYPDDTFETVPVFRNILHSYRQIQHRIEKKGCSLETVKLRLIEIPYDPKTSILQSDTGPRLHAFRFLALNE